MDTQNTSSKQLSKIIEMNEIKEDLSTYDTKTIVEEVITKTEELVKSLPKKDKPVSEARIEAAKNYAIQLRKTTRLTKKQIIKKVCKKFNIVLIDNSSEVSGGGEAGNS